MFEDCFSLESLIIPGSVKRLSQYKYDYDDKYQGIITETFSKSLKKLIINHNNTILKVGFTNDSGSFKERGWSNFAYTIETLAIDRVVNYPITPKSLKRLTLGEHIKEVQVEIKNCNDLTNITCYATTPPTGLIANNKLYLNTEVKVPKGCLEAYQNAEGWKNFWNMSEMEDGESGVDSVIADEAKTEIGRYNLQGHKVGDDYRGMVIIKYSDGSTRKILKN